MYSKSTAELYMACREYADDNECFFLSFVSRWLFVNIGPIIVSESFALCTYFAIQQKCLARMDTRQRRKG